LHRLANRWQFISGTLDCFRHLNLGSTLNPGSEKQDPDQKLRHKQRAPDMKQVQNARRVSIQKALEVFQRGRWLCHWCGRPVIFAPTLKYLEHFVRNKGFKEPLAYYHAHWTRHHAPLLDYMGAVIDHVEAHRSGGKSDKTNLVTACCKCNALKSDAKFEVFQQKLQRHTVDGRYGEPEHWDGLSTLFAILVEHSSGITTANERAWLKALKGPSARISRPAELSQGSKSHSERV
jgi:hypothetical protein